MSATEPTSVALLEQYYLQGDRSAVETLLERHHAWLWAYVSRHMSPAQRAFETSEDVVQDLLRRLIEQGPRFLPQDDEQFRRLVATIALNHLRNRHDWVHAARRSPAALRSLEASSISRLGIAARSGESPSQKAIQHEEQRFLELGLLLIDPEDAHVIRLREWEAQDFQAIARTFGIVEASARSRYHRAVRRLGHMVKRLMEGNLEGLAPDLPPLVG